MGERAPEAADSPAGHAATPPDLPPGGPELLDQLANLWQVELGDDDGPAVAFRPGRRA